MVGCTESSHCAAAGGLLPGWKGAPKLIQGPPPAKGDQGKPGPALGKGVVAPKAGEAAP